MDNFYGPTPFFDLDDIKPTVIPEADCVDANGKPILANSLTDVLISAEVLLTQVEEQQLAKILRRLVDRDGQVIGQHHKNHLLNMLMYDIEFPNGDVRKYAANIIAVNVLAQVDPEVYHTNVHGVILDHKRDGTAVPMSGKYFKMKQGRQTQRKSTLVWELQIKWKNGSKQWVKLKGLKESNPVDVA